MYNNLLLLPEMNRLLKLIDNLLVNNFLNIFSYFH